MKKQLIAVGLAGLLAIPTVSFGEEMAGASLYGSFRAGLKFGSGNATVNNYVSRWGIKGSHEVAEGLTAAYKYEANINLANAESAGGAGHKHAAVAAVPPGEDTVTMVSIISTIDNTIDANFDHDGDMDDTDPTILRTRFQCADNRQALLRMTDDEEVVTFTDISGESYETGSEEIPDP